MEEDLLFEGGQRYRWVDAEFLAEDFFGAAESAERVGLSPGSVEGEHEELPEALVEGMLADECFETGDELGVTAPSEGDLHVPGEEAEVDLVETPDFDLSEAVVLDAGVGRASPEAAGLVDVLGGEIGVAWHRSASGCYGGFETSGIELGGVELESVSVARGDQRVGLAVDESSQLGDVKAEGAEPGRVVAPQLVDNAVARERLVRVDQQERK